AALVPVDQAADREEVVEALVDADSGSVEQSSLALDESSRDGRCRDAAVRARTRVPWRAVSPVGRDCRLGNASPVGLAVGHTASRVRSGRLAAARRRAAVATRTRPGASFGEDASRLTGPRWGVVMRRIAAWHTRLTCAADILFEHLRLLPQVGSHIEE